MLTIGIVDDHPLYRYGLSQILKSYSENIDIVEFSSGEKLIGFLNHSTLNFCFVDINLGSENGLVIARNILQKNDLIRIIFVSMATEKALVEKAIEIGAHAYLFKESGVEEIKHCLESVQKGLFYISEGYFENLADDSSKLLLIPELTDTEKLVLLRTSFGMSSKEIADEFHITSKSVDNYRSRICKKILIEGSSSSLLIWALKHKNSIQKLLID